MTDHVSRCACEPGTCNGIGVIRCAILPPAVNDDSLERLRSGADIVVPTSRHHAECMYLVAESYMKEDRRDDASKS